MKAFIYSFFVGLFLVVSHSCSPKQFLVVSYNVENLFDTLKNSGSGDMEYIPESPLNWNSEKYQNKLRNLSKVLSSIDSKRLPDFIGLVEVENRSVVEDLSKTGNLLKGNYSVSHFEGPDPRGIEVAFMYSKKFKPVQEMPIKVYTDSLRRYRSRDILYVKGILEGDTLYFFVNHWKSRRGSEETTERKRVAAANLLRQFTDSILGYNPKAKIIIMGDFNDTPADSSLRVILGAEKPGSGTRLVNITYPLHKQGLGTHFYGNAYSMIDNFVVSEGLLSASKGIFSDGKAAIFSPEWISYKTKAGHWAPARTFSGKNYFNGYSDHYPIYFYLKKR